MDFQALLNKKAQTAQVVGTPPVGTPVANPAPNKPAPFNFPKTNSAAVVAAVSGLAFQQDQRAKKIRDAMMSAKIGGKRNDLPEGTGLFLIKEGIYALTSMQQARLTKFSLYCVKGIEDGQKLTPASAQYTGPRAGETYEYVVFHDSKYPNILGSQYLQITAACMGWTKEQVAAYQQSAEGQEAISELTSRILCIDANGNQLLENGQPVNSIMSNQAILEITKKSQIKDKKVNGQPVFDAQGAKVQIPVTNVYWNKRIWISDAMTAGVFATEADVVKAFGSMEAASQAATVEQQYHQG
jgi:hypothetical protein